MKTSVVEISEKDVLLTHFHKPSFFILILISKMDKLFVGKYVSAIVLFCYFFLNSFYNYTVTGSGLETDPYEIHERLILIVNETTSMNPLGIFKEEN